MIRYEVRRKVKYGKGFLVAGDLMTFEEAKLRCDNSKESNAGHGEFYVVKITIETETVYVR